MSFREGPFGAKVEQRRQENYITKKHRLQKSRPWVPFREDALTVR